MSGVGHSTTGLRHVTAMQLRSHPNALNELPDTSFTTAECSEPAADLVLQVADTRAVAVEGTRRRDGDTVRVYRLTDSARQMRDRILSDMFTPLPCGHTGLVNLNGSDYACGWEPCEQQYGREKVQL